GNSVYELNTETWRWTRKTTSGHGSTVPPSAATTATLGRWRYVPALRVFVVVNHVSRNVFLYKH
ncbi:MAG: galactose oxidase, partial [Planctomycetota bacterium]